MDNKNLAPENNDFFEKDDIVFDIGANKGDMTKVYLEKGCIVHAFEINRELCVFMKERFPDQVREGRLFIHNYAISNEDGKADVIKCQADTLTTLSTHWTEGRFKDFSWSRGGKINTSKIATFCSIKSIYPKYIKIDVEGHEYPVICSMTPKSLKKCTMISFEYTKEFLKEAWKCMQELKSLGFSKFGCSYFHNNGLYWDDYRDITSLYGHLEIINDSGLWGDIYAIKPPKRYIYNV